MLFSSVVFRGYIITDKFITNNKHICNESMESYVMVQLIFFIIFMFGSVIYIVLDIIKKIT